MQVKLNAPLIPGSLFMFHGISLVPSMGTICDIDHFLDLWRLPCPLFSTLEHYNTLSFACYSL